MSKQLTYNQDGRMPSMMTDAEAVGRIQSGETELFELLIRRHNMRLFRTIRSQALDDNEAEDALQATYLKAWQALDSFERRSSFITWITRIAIREASACTSRRQRDARLNQASRQQEQQHNGQAARADFDMESREMVHVLEDQIDTLPEAYRQVFVLCAVQEVPALEVATCLELSLSNVRVRLHRARHMLQTRLAEQNPQEFDPTLAWAFAGERCQRMVQRVLERIRGLGQA